MTDSPVLRGSLIKKRGADHLELVLGYSRNISLDVLPNYKGWILIFQEITFGYNGF